MLKSPYRGFCINILPAMIDGGADISNYSRPHQRLSTAIFPVHAYDIDIIAGCGVIIRQASLKTWSTSHHPWSCMPFIDSAQLSFCGSGGMHANAQITYIIKLIRHRNHGGYKSVMTSYARAVQLIQLLPSGLRPSHMSNNLISDVWYLFQMSDMYFRLSDIISEK